MVNTNNKGNESTLENTVSTFLFVAIVLEAGNFFFGIDFGLYFEKIAKIIQIFFEQDICVIQSYVFFSWPV